ncbi:hypothetical protein [Mesorhizobium sp. CAU 1741]|uniref:hypothetical protein n=1 Tax=Mesorhizobium sp. CAU 1741 TaxID=3140366 RepID=UPI00325B67E2
MLISFALATDEAIALRRMAAEMNVELPEAAQAALRDWLVGHGYLELPEAANNDED